MRAAAISLPLLLLVSGCVPAHEASDGGPEDGGPEAACPDLDALVEWSRRRDQLACAEALRCYTDGADGYFLRGSLDACSGPDEDRAALCALLADGMTFHADRATQCLDELAARSSEPCLAPADLLGPEMPPDIYDTTPSICWEVLDARPVALPTRPGDCVCPAGWSCLAAPTCGGVCTSPAGEGEECGARLCGELLHCDFATNTCQPGCDANYQCTADEYCIDGSCSPATLPGIGEPCLDTSGGSLCAGDHTYCHELSHTCAMQVGGDVACDSAGGPAACFTGTCDPSSSTCLPEAYCFPATAVRDHRFCTPAVPYCDLEWHCTASTTQVACTGLNFAYGVDGCPPGMGCDLRADEFYGRCRPRADLGTACDETVVCANGTTCAGGVCLAIAGGGQPCGDVVVCAPRFACVEGRCEATTHGGLIGDRCSTNVDCYYGACTDGLCAWPPAGAACSRDRECRAAGGCIDGACGSFAIVGDGERCDDPDVFCADDLRCLPTGERDSMGRMYICRASCPSP